MFVMFGIALGLSILRLGLLYDYLHLFESRPRLKLTPSRNLATTRASMATRHGDNDRQPNTHDETEWISLVRNV